MKTGLRRSIGAEHGASYLVDLVKSSCARFCNSFSAGDTHNEMNLFQLGHTPPRAKEAVECE